MLARLRDNNLVGHLGECQFELSELRNLGFIVGKDGLKPDPAKVQIVQDWPTPKGPGDVRSFLDLVDYFRRFFTALAAAFYAQDQERPTTFGPIM